MASGDAEAAHLCWLIEKQASCLMRVAADGTLLAVSDAALNLLGASELAQVLDTNLTARLAGEGNRLWTDFTTRVFTSGSGSAECEMTTLAGTRRAVMLLGVACANHPDGVQSLIVTARDVSAVRRLEKSLHEQENLRKSLDELRAQLAAIRDRDQKRQRMFGELVDARIKAETKLTELRKELELLRSGKSDAVR